MNAWSIHTYTFLLIFLILLSAFFSGAETGNMFLNHYRLRHLVRKKHRAAIRVDKLLQRPDRLLGVVLIGNTFANIFASSVATIVMVHYFGEMGVVYASLALTFIILIFSETLPKTLASLHPMRFAFLVSIPLMWCLKLFYPLVWADNIIVNSLLRLFGVHVKKRDNDPLSAEELRSVVHEAKGMLSDNYHQILLRILDLEAVSIESVMIPRADIYGIDLTHSWDTIMERLINSPHRHVPLYRENMDQIEGVITVRKALALLAHSQLSVDLLRTLAYEPYFIPEGTLLNQQLLNFQKHKIDIGFVIDEYGDILGLVKINDILEEIVGEFVNNSQDMTRLIQKEKSGSVLIFD